MGRFLQAFWRSRPKGLKCRWPKFPKKYESFDFVNHRVARIDEKTEKFVETTYVIPSKPVPAKFFVTGEFVKCDVIEVRKLTFVQFGIALFKSQFAWWYGGFLMTLKRIDLLDIEYGEMYSLHKFTFRIWTGKIKKMYGGR